MGIDVLAFTFLAVIPAANLLFPVLPSAHYSAMRPLRYSIAGLSRQTHHDKSNSYGTSISTKPVF
jgi:hypothetical protein